jgi:hypothetical protein
MESRSDRRRLSKGASRQRILIWLAAVSGVFFIYLFFFGVSAWFVIVEGRRLAGQDDPSLWITPVALTDLSTSAPAQKLSYLGYEFEVPWDDLDEQKTIHVHDWQLIVFRSGNSIVFYTSPPDEFVNSFFKQDSGRESALARSYVDDYHFIDAALESTPGQIGLFTPVKHAARVIFLLLIKSIVMGANHDESGVFLIQTKDFHGFQYGNPASHPPEIQADLFSDKVHLHFVFPNKKNAGFISQPEINRVIQSVHAVQ